MSLREGLSNQLKAVTLSATMAMGGAQIASASDDACADGLDALTGNETKVELAQRRPATFKTPDAPLKSIKVPFASSFANSKPITQTSFQALIAYSSGQVYKNSASNSNLTDEKRENFLKLAEQKEQEFRDSFPIINVLVIKGGNAMANARYERAVRIAMQNVTNSYPEAHQKVEGVFAAHPEEDIKIDEKSSSGGILLYVNDWPVEVFYPKSFDREEMLCNIKRAQTYVSHLFDRGYHLSSYDEFSKRVKEKQLASKNIDQITKSGDDSTGRGDSSQATDTVPDVSFNPG